MPDTRTKSNNQESSTNIYELIKKISDKLDVLSEQVKDLASKLDHQNKAISILQSDFIEIAKKNNDLEQRSREHCRRIWGLQHAAVNTNDPLEISTIVFNALKPILDIAKLNKIIEEIPNRFELIDTAHILPKGKLPVHPIHVRLRSKNYWMVIMKSKKEYFKNSGNKWSIGDELTAANAKLLKQTKNRDDVKSAWMASTKIKFKKINDEKIYIADISEHLIQQKKSIIHDSV